MSLESLETCRRDRFLAFLSLRKLPGQRQALRDCLAGALGQMGPEPPERQKKEKAKLLIHEDTGQLLTHLDQQQLGSARCQRE